MRWETVWRKKYKTLLLEKISLQKMFEKFTEFAGETDFNNADSISSFLKLTYGKSYLEGLYRFFEEEKVSYWNEIVESCFPEYEGAITVMSYDWMGRIFAIEKASQKVILFEIGSGDVYDTDADVLEFHDDLIAEHPEECLVSELFADWRSANNNISLKAADCVSYKVPLMLGGGDDFENLDLCDMDVYWEILKPVILGTDVESGDEGL